MKSIICWGIIILMVFIATPVYAADLIENPGEPGVITPKFTYISWLSSGLSINSWGKATCLGSASAYDSSHTTNLTVKLQKSNAGGWSTTKSWSASSTGTSLAKVEENYYVAHGTYRVCATAKVYNSSGTLLESKSVYSNTVTY